MPVDDSTLHKMAQRLRRDCLESTAEAGSGHPTSCMSATELVSVLFFDEMRFDPRDPSGRDQDVFVLSKGHAAPVLWSVLKEAGCIDDDLKTLRRFDSRLEGHPTPRVPWVRVATGSLGQGLCAGVGMAWARKLDKSEGRVYVLLGDGEAAEGSVWEAAEFASFYGLDNVCAVFDVNRLGQSGPTMYEHHLEPYLSRLRGFGWEAAAVDGHDGKAVREAYARARATKGKPFGIVARTFKGKGVSFLENKEGWHGKPVKKGEKFKDAAPERFAEAYIAEQNMVGAALGMSSEGKVPFASTFACFLTRAYDFIRMAAYSRPSHLVLCGSHAGISIGEDGPSQMALEDLAMMRALLGTTVLYPSDAVSGERLVETAARTPGIVYIRTSRPKTKVLYDNGEPFPVGGSKTLRTSPKDRVTIVAAGVT